MSQQNYMAFSDKAPGHGTNGISIPPAVAAFRQALATFPPAIDFPKQFGKLQKLVNELTAEDLGLDPIFSNPMVWKNPDKPPCTYIEVFQNEDVNMGIFILAPGYKMPLHDHPHMHGLLKVIKGAVEIRSFTETPLTGEVTENGKNGVNGVKGRCKRYFTREKFFAEVTSTTICKESSPCCMLTPTYCNLHEIQAIELPAAFFDILSPPYSDDDTTGERQCHYYKVVNEISSNLVEMQEIDLPAHYFCDQAPYEGPRLY